MSDPIISNNFTICIKSLTKTSLIKKKVSAFNALTFYLLLLKLTNLSLLFSSRYILLFGFKFLLELRFLLKLILEASYFLLRVEGT